MAEEAASKRSKPQHTLVEWMYDKYRILRFFATEPSDAARHLNKYHCRVCLVELSLKTKVFWKCYDTIELMQT